MHRQRPEKSPLVTAPYKGKRYTHPTIGVKPEASLPKENTGNQSDIKMQILTGAKESLEAIKSGDLTALLDVHLYVDHTSSSQNSGLEQLGILPHEYYSLCSQYVQRYNRPVSKVCNPCSKQRKQ